MFFRLLTHQRQSQIKLQNKTLTLSDSCVKVCFDNTSVVVAEPATRGALMSLSNRSNLGLVKFGILARTFVSQVKSEQVADSVCESRLFGVNRFVIL